MIIPCKMPSMRKYRRDTSEVSCCLKYVIFSVNVLFWVSSVDLNIVFGIKDILATNCKLDNNPSPDKSE